MSWPEQDPYGGQYPPSQYPQAPHSASPYSGAPHSGPPASQYPAAYGGYGYPPVAPPTNTLAVVALILAFVCFPAGIICGHIARGQIRQSGEQGGGMATAAITIGYIAAGIVVLICCGWGAMMMGLLGAASSGSSYGG